jgi:hypothetical protein
MYWKVVLGLAMAGVLALMTLCGAGPATSPAPATQPSGAPVRVSAIVTVGDNADDDHVWMILKNVSDRPFYYVRGGKTALPVLTSVRLVQADGQVVSGGRTPGWDIRREDVRELKPGEQIEFRAYVGRAIYSEMKPGLYSLYTEMNVSEHMQNEYGMTPVDIDQFVCHVRVPEPKPAPTTAPTTAPVPASPH